MAYRTEREGNGEEAIVIDGWEGGISPSPHMGIANLQNVNITNDLKEVMCSYTTTQQSMTVTTSTGSASFVDSSHLNFSISGSNSKFKGMWIVVTNTSNGGQLANGTYWCNLSSGSGFTLSTTYGGAALTSYLTGLTATIALLRNMSQPVEWAHETYQQSGTNQYRYYVLDSQGLVWVYDTALASTTDSIAWFLPDPSITYFGSDTAPSGIGVLNGWLMAVSGNKIWVKKTVNLGSDTSGTWVQMDNALLMSLASSKNPHRVFVGHQGRAYITDGNYLDSIFPDSTIATAGQTNGNVQSYASYTASAQTGTISNLYSGSIPSTGSNVGVTGFSRIPAVFFTDAAGTHPTNLTANTVYYIQYSTANANFVVYPAYTGADTAKAVGSFVGGESSAILTTQWTYQTGTYQVTFSNGDIRTVTFTNASTAITWSIVLSSSASDTLIVNGLNIATGAAGNQFYNTFFVVGTHAGAYGDTPTMTWTPQRMGLPYGEVANCMTEVGNNVIIGAQSNILYPWNQTDPLPSGLIFLPEANTVKLLTVNQVAYAFTGNKGNIYLTDGSVASLAIKVPDFCAGIAGTVNSYYEPYFTWGGAMYLRGRVYFSILDQTSSKTGNCGGVWSFIPTQNLYIGQDIGLALRLENQLSYATYNGVAPVLIPADTQSAISPQYWAAWYSSVSSATYGIDFTGTQFGSSAVIETDLIPVGTMLKKFTPQQIEYKLAEKLSSASESVSISWRSDLSSSYTSAGTAITEGSQTVSGYFRANFENVQWVQLKITLTPFASSTVSPMRLREVRIR